MTHIKKRDAGRNPIASPKVSLALWLLTCLIVLGLFLPALLIERPNIADKNREVFTVLVKYWEVAYGEEQPKENEWTVFDADAKSGLADDKGTVWLRRELPELNWRSPYLFFSGMTRFEVYLEEKLRYSYNMDGRDRQVHPMANLHPVPFDPGDAGKLLTIRAEWEGYPFIGNDLVLAGEPDQILFALLKAEAGLLVYSMLNIAAGLAGFALLVRRKEKLYGWFGLLGVSIGFTLLFSCRSLQWFSEMGALYYWKDIFFPMAMLAFVGFYGEAMGAARKRLVKAARYAIIAFFAVYLCAAVWQPLLYWKLSVQGLVVVAVIDLVAVSYGLLRYPQLPDRGAERKWLIRGYWVLAACAISGMSLFMFPTAMNHLLLNWTYVYRVFESLQPNGVLLFMICMVMVVASSVSRVHMESERNALELLAKNRELEQFHRNLERLVETRTEELAEANLHLAETLRERAESLAEISVLEERNRIAYEMHDVVGHTLTAAIVQLEATKKLAAGENGVPPEKLDMLSGLVRKGLDDIRGAVRLLKTEEMSLPLDVSLLELIQYAEDTMDIRVDADIFVPAELQLGRLAEQVLYHALQEGLTNGIRHGRCTRFRFSLRPSGKLLRFRLVSDGEPFGSAVPGFGLAAMKERVELMGGVLSVSSSVSKEGAPEGCALSIDLPLPAGREVG
ncbi:histidine kinase [Paenibacillus sp. LHD-117]|uniref:sensor histidine kinase n=1 Tax=Paenibacillus sp. LHD-117 TaxID=3071412 RepID=UPI0027DF896B|nr:histidine kinase [Paenibacillus sp. LHD-117]MDQ6419661.1 histidine kinase [Paenibacillus sp. LHD-117]